MKICVADDNSVVLHILESALANWGFEAVVARDGAEAWQLIKDDPKIRLALLDWMMPHTDGVELCERIRREVTDRYVYIILLTARNHVDDLCRGFNAGADDYVAKPFQLQELQARLSVGKRQAEVQERLISARETLRQQAMRDGLTGLWNHRSILDIMQRELVRADREKRPLGVCLGDLDHFKQVNDTYGHMAGDTVLVEVTKRMQSLLRPYDMIGRYGGEEFLVVMPGCDVADALAIGGRLREQVALQTIQHENDRISVTLSLGVSVYLPEQCTPEPAFMLHTADMALYRAKRLGRNRIEVDLVEAGGVTSTTL